jgi:hypothetical protein
MKYVKKPIVIEAFQWTGDINQLDDPLWIVDAIKAGSVRFRSQGTPDVVMDIDTLEGTMTVRLGDYIIRGIKGEIYPCKPDIFAASYEPAAEAVASMQLSADLPKITQLVRVISAARSFVQAERDRIYECERLPDGTVPCEAARLDLQIADALLTDIAQSLTLTFAENPE